MLTKEGIRCFWAAMFVYFDGKDGCLSLHHNRSLSVYILPRSRIWVICQEMFLFIIIFVIKQVEDQDQSSSRIMFSGVADGKLFPWGRYSPASTTTTQSRGHGAIELYFQKSTRNWGKDRNRRQNLSPCHLNRSPDRDGCRGEGRSVGKISTWLPETVRLSELDCRKNKTKWNLMLWQIKEITKKTLITSWQCSTLGSRGYLFSYL